MKFVIKGEGITDGVVSGVEAGLVGPYEDGKPYRPNDNEVRELIPRKWRKAFDRSTWWFINGEEYFYSVLDSYDVKRSFTTIYAYPKKD